MKVIKSEDNLLEFDNGLVVEGDGESDCCANNYLDFEQLPVGTELRTMSIDEFIKAIVIKEDGFAVKDIQNTPKWVQARSGQNGYYSSSTGLIIKQDGKQVQVANFEGEVE